MHHYEPATSLCELCKTNSSVLLPICEVKGEFRMVPVCLDCRDDLPYEVLPISCVMDTGYVFCTDQGLSQEPIIGSDVPPL